MFRYSCFCPVNGRVPSWTTSWHDSIRREITEGPATMNGVKYSTTGTEIVYTFTYSIRMHTVGDLLKMPQETRESACIPTNRAKEREGDSLSAKSNLAPFCPFSSFSPFLFKPANLGGTFFLSSSPHEESFVPLRVAGSKFQPGATTVQNSTTTAQ